MIGSGLLVIDLEELSQFFNCFIEKMRSSVTNQDLGATKTRNDVLMKKDGGLLGICRLNRLGFCPLG